MDVKIETGKEMRELLWNSQETLVQWWLVYDSEKTGKPIPEGTQIDRTKIRRVLRMLAQIAFGGPDDQKRTPRVYGSMPAENVYQLGLEMKQAGEEMFAEQRAQEAEVELAKAENENQMRLQKADEFGVRGAGEQEEKFLEQLDALSRRDVKSSTEDTVALGVDLGQSGCKNIFN